MAFFAVLQHFLGALALFDFSSESNIRCLQLGRAFCYTVFQQFICAADIVDIYCCAEPRHGFSAGWDRFVMD
jgi:hypothetical protein